MPQLQCIMVAYFESQAVLLETICLQLFADFISLLTSQSSSRVIPWKASSGFVSINFSWLGQVCCPLAWWQYLCLEPPQDVCHWYGPCAHYCTYCSFFMVIVYKQSNAKFAKYLPWLLISHFIIQYWIANALQNRNCSNPSIFLMAPSVIPVSLILYAWLCLCL